MTVLPLHIIGGVLALVSGYVALYAAKGASTHRRSGTVFVFAMVVMSLTGAFIAVLHDEPVSVIAGLLTFYFVTTAMLTVKREPQSMNWVNRVAVLFAVAVSILAFKTGFEVAGAGRPEAGPMFLFGGLGLVAVKGDLRVIRARAIDGRRRIARHLWRMCFAMWVAAASFFWGPQGRVPEIIRIPALQAIAVLLPVAVMLYWLWRLRARRTVTAKGLQPAEAR
jgi:hypothetical protein